MLKKIISKIKPKMEQKKELDFFDLPVDEQEKLIIKAAELSAQDQKNMLEEYDRKFGKLQTNNCK